MQLNIMQTMRAIQSATVAARCRLNDQTIGTRVDNGRVQVVRVVYDGSGNSDVTPVSEWMPVSEAAAYIATL